MPLSPTISNVTPSGGAVLPTDVIQFDVTDVSVLAMTVVVWVAYPSTGETEMVYNGSAFTSRFPSSTRIAIANGYTFTLSRVGGWPAAPQIEVEAFEEP